MPVPRSISTTKGTLRPDWSFLARVEDVPASFDIGFMDLSTNPPGGYVCQVGVIPAFRHRGLSAALMIASMQRIHAEGAPMVQLTVNINNPGAKEAYERLGFVVHGSRAEYEQISG